MIQTLLKPSSINASMIGTICPQRCPCLLHRLHLQHGSLLWASHSAHLGHSLRGKDLRTSSRQFRTQAAASVAEKPQKSASAKVRLHNPAHHGSLGGPLRASWQAAPAQTQKRNKLGSLTSSEVVTNSCLACRPSLRQSLV